MVSPEVSILLSYRNSEKTLEQALHSIIGQTFENWELILLDDGSTDGSDKVVERMLDERIRWYRDSVCRGLGARLNQGIDLARGELIARMDADDISFPDRLAMQVDYLHQHPEVDLLAGHALLLGKDDVPIGVLPGGLDHQDIVRRPWLGFPMPHPTWMGRRAWFCQFRYNDNARKAQDQEMLYRAFANSRYAGLDAVLLAYRYSGLSLRKTFEGRLSYLLGIARQKDWRNLLKGGMMHSAALVRDIAAILIGQDQSIIKRRTLPVPSPLLARWRSLNHSLWPDHHKRCESEPCP